MNKVSCTQHAAITADIRHVVFMSSNPGAWGGSEELWHATARKLQTLGLAVSAIKNEVIDAHPRIQSLRDTGITVLDSRIGPALPIRLVSRMIGLGGRWTQLGTVLGRLDLRLRRYNPFISAELRQSRVWPAHPVYCALLEGRPDLVVISQGDNYDGAEFSEICATLNLPFVVICHKARQDRWPHDGERARFRSMFERAVRAYFVSNHNWKLTQQQIGLQMKNAELVRNPHLAQVDAPLPWQSPSDGRFHLACVGRLWTYDKGQDLLLEVLAMPKWKARELHVAFYGEGVNREGLADMAASLGIEHVSFPGFVDDIVAIWREHHALVLPSRAEGLPISLIEAMMCGRIGIVTRVGGSAELMIDNETGFVAAEPSSAAIDEALERAWAHREGWGRMGQAAAQTVRQFIPSDPPAAFADMLLRLMGSRRTTS
jgi:glycosyltransferase involved in cell wall biosynthesis